MVEMVAGSRGSLTIGSKYARVFPEPVWDASKTSPPAIISCTAAACTSGREFEPRSIVTLRGQLFIATWFSEC